MLVAEKFKKPVVFCANGIGDHLIALPTLRALSHLFLGRLSLIVLPEAYKELFVDITFNSVWFIEIVDLDSNYDNLTQKTQNIGRKPFNYETLAKEAQECDLFISISKWQTKDLELLIEKISPSVSLSFFPNSSYQIPDVGNNCFETIFSTVHLFAPEIKMEEFSQPPKLNPQYISLVQSLKKFLDQEYKLLIVHTDTKRRKMWSSDKFLITIDKFLSLKTNYIAMIIGSFHELPLELADQKNRIFDLCHLPINLSFALLSVADLFVGIDSCILHAADLFRVPGVGIFVDTDPQEWGFRFAPHKHIYSDVINSIEPDQVINAMMSLS